MGYYSRQACGGMIRTVFRRVAEQLLAAQEAEMASRPPPEPSCRFGVRAAVNILEFLIDLIQKGPTLQVCRQHPWLLGRGRRWLVVSHAPPS
jgi:brefeldin A-resistance guanine nucleotide exchange factor 1